MFCFFWVVESLFFKFPLQTQSGLGVIYLQQPGAGDVGGGGGGDGTGIALRVGHDRHCLGLSFNII